MLAPALLPSTARLSLESVIDPAGSWLSPPAVSHFPCSSACPWCSRPWHSWPNWAIVPARVLKWSK